MTKKRKLSPLHQKIKAFPGDSGVYLMKDEKGQILYVGKAKNLKARVRQYFSGHDTRFQIRFLMARVYDIDFRKTPSEKEALLLENSLIKKYKPRYNFFLKDDKTYLSLKITAHDYPKLVETRRVKKDGGIYFGPFTNTDSLRRVKEFIYKYFQLRTCGDHDFAIRTRPCLEYQIKRCSAPCVGYVSKEEYAKQVEGVRFFLQCKNKTLQRYLKRSMKEASQKEDFENAARLRDLLQNMEKIFEKPNVTPLFSSETLLKNLQEILHLNKIPSHIEGLDISNTSGKQATGSLVTFLEGSPRKDLYKKFRIKSLSTPNDYEMMVEVLKRRFKTNWQKPDLLVIDGGKGQLNKALKVFKELTLSEIDVVAIAKGRGPGARAKGEWVGKKTEEIYIPNRKNPIVLKSNSAELKFLQSLRDESHRFAITYHRQLREKQLTKSLLDEIPGIGPKTKRALLRRFGSVEGISLASREALFTTHGITEKIYKGLTSTLKKEKNVDDLPKNKR